LISNIKIFSGFEKNSPAKYVEAFNFIVGLRIKKDTLHYNLRHSEFSNYLHCYFSLFTSKRILRPLCKASSELSTLMANKRF